MGMYMNLVTISDSNIQCIVEDPPLVWRIIAPEDHEVYEAERAKEFRPTLLSRMFGHGQRERHLVNLNLSSAEGISTDLDKAWHGIHYLLTRTAWKGVYPWSFLLNGGVTIGNVDMGYGPARAFKSTETREIYSALTTCSEDELTSRFDPKNMLDEQIYPEIWGRDPEEDDSLEYLLEYFQILRGYLQQAVDSNVGILVYVA